jgi:hypothetical protein
MPIIYINFAHVTPGQIVCMPFNPCTEEPVTSISNKNYWKTLNIIRHIT